MEGQLIYECQICFPSLNKAKRLVPEMFVHAYDWFIKRENVRIPKLPHYLGEDVDGVPLTRLSGIHSPSARYSNINYSKARYALSVHTSASTRYGDKDPIALGNGTWVLDYAAQESNADPNRQQGYNEWLMNCLDDGVPVGVITSNSDKKGYTIRGLAFVERYNSGTRMFTLHGPVNEHTESLGLFNFDGAQELSEKERITLSEWDYTDERERTLVEQVRRRQQRKFRELLFQAYEGECAITNANVPQVLQAAHIDPYRGMQSQVASNGLLLRADMHLLYDSHLISVDPDTMQLRIAERLRRSHYVRYNMTHLRLPNAPDAIPREDLLGNHFDQFRNENQMLPPDFIIA